MKYKNSLIALVLFLSAFGSSHAQSPTDYTALLARVDQAVSFQDHDLSAEYTIDKRDPGGAVSTTVATMFRRDRTGQFLILVLQPAIDKGKGYLKIDDSLWLYDPVDRVFTFTSAKERFQNSSFRNSDFNRSNFSSDYKPVSGKREKLGKFDTTVLDLQATNDKVSFPRMRIWVSDDNLVRKIEDYSLSGQLMRTSAIPSYQKVGDKWVATGMVILDHLKMKKIGDKTEYERTTVTIKKPSVSALPDSVYTKEYLEKVSQ
ncbi:MAG: outer membrane lipoprotein-sorting protein [Spirochaetes bacterium GWB1_59_5]|nr:MAG: outer membrane lipoprotein-sorting protein [Spirochaetes bacterium GWB1_59_5]